MEKTLDQLPETTRKVMEIKAVLDQLIAERDAFWNALSEYDSSSEFYFTVDILEGEDHFGEKIWTQKFKTHEKGMAGSYAALYCVGQTVRLTRVKRYLPGSESGTVEKELISDEVPDAYDGLIQKLGL
jgi:hypothetical protein